MSPVLPAQPTVGIPEARTLPSGVTGSSLLPLPQDQAPQRGPHRPPSLPGPPPRSHLIVVSITRAQAGDSRSQRERLGRAGGALGDPGHCCTLLRMSLQSRAWRGEGLCLSPLKIWQTARRWVSEPWGRCWRRQGGPRARAAVGHAVRAVGQLQPPGLPLTARTRGGRRRERPEAAYRRPELSAEGISDSPVWQGHQATVQAKSLHVKLQGAQRVEGGSGSSSRLKSG